MELKFSHVLLVALLSSLAWAATGSLMTQPTYLGAVYVNNQSYYSPYPAEPSGFVDLYVRVSNPGNVQEGTTVDGIECNLVSKPPFTVTNGENRYVGMLKRGDQALLQYRLSVSSDAAPGENRLDIQCRSAGTDWRSTELKIYVQVADAVLDVTHVTTEPATVEPGSYGKITLKLQNLARVGLKNVLINFDLSSASLPLSPVGQSTLVSVANISAGGSVDAPLNFFVDADATSKAYNIPVTITYYDELNNKYSKSLLVSAIIYSTPLVTAALAEQPVALPNSKAKVTINVYNRGLSDIKLASVTLADGGNITLLSPTETYLGTVNSDDFASVDYDVFVKDFSGVLELPVAVSFVDSGNQRKTVELKVPLRVYSAAEANSLGLLPAGGITMWIIGLVVVVVAYFGYKRFFKKKHADK